MYTALACVHKCFTLMGHLKSSKSECFRSSAEHTTQAVIAVKKNVYAKAKIVNSLHG